MGACCSKNITNKQKEKEKGKQDPIDKKFEEN